MTNADFRKIRGDCITTLKPQLFHLEKTAE
jgi:hypothetical protein